MKKMKSNIALVICMLMVIGLVAACSSKNNNVSPSATPSSEPTSTETASTSPEATDPVRSTDPITFDMFVNFSWYGNEWNDPVAKNLTAATGVSLNITKPVSDDNQKLNIMLSNKQLPDLVLLDKADPALQRMIEGGLLYSIDELIEQYTPEMKEVLPKEALANYKSSDGKTYALVSFIEGEKYIEAAKEYNSLISSNQGTWSIRQDYWEEIGKPELSNPDAFVAALEQIQAKHKDKIGLYTNAVGVSTAKNLNTGSIVSLGTSNYFGAQAMIKDGDTIKSGLRSPEYQAVIKFLNKLATKGLLTKDSYIDSKDIYSQKINNGDPVTYTWTIADGTKIPGDNQDTSYKIMTPFSTYKQVRDGSGWTAIAIPKTNKDPKRAIEFLAFLASEDGHKITKWGVEGETYTDPINGAHYHMEDGKASYLPEYRAALKKDFDGIIKQNKLSEYWLAANSIWWNGPEWDANDVELIEYNKMFSPYIEYDPTLSNMLLDPTSDIGITEKKIVDLYTGYYSKIIFAKDEATALAIYAEFLEKAEKIGLAAVEQAWSERYKANNANR